MKIEIASQWQQKLAPFFTSPQWQELEQFLEQAYEQQCVYPPKTEIFRALQLTDYNQVRVVIIGQDPYHGENQANGLSFSVCSGEKIPPSLRNIFLELHNDLGIQRSETDLSDWANQGVLLLNTVLTVAAQQANSHQGKGWECLTSLVIDCLNQAPNPIVFVLWGKSAQQYRQQITEEKHLVIESAHPSPLSAYRGFFGSQPFSKINQFLVECEKQPIAW